MIKFLDHLADFIYGTSNYSLQKICEGKAVYVDVKDTVPYLRMEFRDRLNAS
jgi:hypothetical protein